MSGARILRALALGAGLAAATISLTWGLLFYRPLPTIDGYYRLLGLHERGEVIRDIHGIPRIYARDAHDLFFLQGYVTAQDRLAQIEELRIAARAAAGAEAERAVDLATPALREALDAYAAGVSKFIAQHTEARALPGELVLGGRRPGPWRPADTLAIVAVFLERIPPSSLCASTAAALTLRGRPLLAADIYLDAPPPGWYEIGLDGAGMRAIGASLPGVPGVAAGHNGRVAWATLSPTRSGPAGPIDTLIGLLGAMSVHEPSDLADLMRPTALSVCVSGRTGVLGGEVGRGAALTSALERRRDVDIETLRVLLGRPAAAVGWRILVDLADVDTSRSAVSHGASAHRASPHFGDQAPLWEVGQVHQLPFFRPAVVRNEGALVFRAR